MSVKDRLIAFVAGNKGFYSAHFDVPDAKALLELVEAVEDYAIYSGPARWQAIRDVLQRITEDS